MDQAISEIIGDITLLLIVIILMLYLTYRDSKRQDIIDTRYDKLINNMIDNVAKQQTVCKRELTAEMKELSITTSKILNGVERMVAAIKDAQPEIEKMTKSVDNISSEMKDVALSLQTITDRIDKEIDSNPKEFEIRDLKNE